MLLSTVAAYDLGYVSSRGLALRVRNSLETAEHLQRYRGASPQLVRHANARATGSPLRLCGRQRQSRGSASRAQGGLRRGPVCALPAGCSLARAGGHDCAARGEPRTRDRRRRRIGHCWTWQAGPCHAAGSPGGGECTGVMASHASEAGRDRVSGMSSGSYSKPWGGEACRPIHRFFTRCVFGFHVSATKSKACKTSWRLSHHGFPFSMRRHPARIRMPPSRIFRRPVRAWPSSSRQPCE